MKSVDDAANLIYKKRNSISWRAFSSQSKYGWYYCENRCYLIRDMSMNKMTIVIASNPLNALEQVTGKLSNAVNMRN